MFRSLKRHLVFLLTITPFLALGQRPDPANNQLWLVYLVDYDLGKKVDLFADASYRAIFNPGGRNIRRFMARPAVKWQISV